MERHNATETSVIGRGRGRGRARALTAVGNPQRNSPPPPSLQNMLEVWKPEGRKCDSLSPSPVQNPKCSNPPTTPIGATPPTPAVTTSKDSAPPPSQFQKRHNSKWMQNRSKVIHLLQLIVADYFDHPVNLKFAGVPQPKLPPLGNVLRGHLLRGLGNGYNPSELYVIFDNVDYSLDNQEWTKFFPPSKSPTRALKDITILLNIFYKMQEEMKATYSTALVPFNLQTRNQGKVEVRERLVPGDLVLFKLFNKLPNTSEYQMTRGLIRSVSGYDSKRKLVIYKVYLLDVGLELKCSENFIVALPKPFHSIAPLAVQCCLFGISPAGFTWKSEAVEKFSKFVDKFPTTSALLFTILSDFKLMGSPLYVSVDIVERDTLTHQGNLTQFLIDEKLGIQWNLFPARPRLMADPKSPPPPSEGNRQSPTVRFQDALLMTPCYLPSLGHAPLPLNVIEREMKALLSLRRHHFVNVLQPFLTVPSEQAFGTLSTSPPSSEESSSKLKDAQPSSSRVPLQNDEGAVPSSEDVDSLYKRSLEQLKKDAQIFHDVEKWRRDYSIKRRSGFYDL